MHHVAMALAVVRVAIAQGGPLARGLMLARKVTVVRPSPR